MPMQTLYAVDLTQLPGADELWRPSPEVSAGRARPAHPALPADGFALLPGYWFASAGAWGTAARPLRVEISDVAEAASPESQRESRSRPTSGCRAQRAIIKFKPDLARAKSSSTNTVSIEIESNVARITVAAESWRGVSEPVLTVVAQLWRFLAIDRSLDELSAWARRDLAKRGFRHVLGWRRSRELYARRRTLQLLILDLPDFELLATNPQAGLAPGRPVAIYRALARQLALDRRRRALDERVEVVEAIYDSLAESLNHYQSLAVQLVLELAIVTLLILDVGLYFLSR
jgi:hypothetical protein